jgi:superfamily II DNA or RNA helicase
MSLEALKKEVAAFDFRSTVLHKYQREACQKLVARWNLMENALENSEEEGKDDVQQGMLLAAKPGLGKTVMAINLALHLFRSKPNSRVLIVVPIVILRQWILEFRDHTNVDAKFMVVYRQHSKLHTIPKNRPCIVFTTYTTLALGHSKHSDARKSGFGALAVPHLFDLLILDEAHLVANPNINRTQAVYRICKLNPRAFKLPMSGTFFRNTYRDLYSQGHIVNSHLKRKEGQREPTSKRQLWKMNRNDPDVINEWRRRSVVSIDHDECLVTGKASGLPTLLTTETTIPLDKPSRTAYRPVMRAALTSLFAAEMNRTRSKQEVQEDKARTIRRLNWLRQICDHPSLIIPELQTFLKENSEEPAEHGCFERTYTTAKVAEIKKIMDAHVKDKPDTKFLIFSCYLKFLELLHEEHVGNDPRFKVGVIRGGRKYEERSALYKDFREDGLNVLLSTPQSGGLGLNLTVGDRECVVIFCEEQWNRTITEQARCRVWRLGQRGTVHVYNIVVKDTVEEGISHLTKVKERNALAWLKDGRIIVPEDALQALKSYWKSHMYRDEGIEEHEVASQAEQDYLKQVEAKYKNDDILQQLLEDPDAFETEEETLEDNADRLDLKRRDDDVETEDVDSPSSSDSERSVPEKKPYQRRVAAPRPLAKHVAATEPAAVKLAVDEFKPAAAFKAPRAVSRSAPVFPPVQPMLPPPPSPYAVALPPQLPFYAPAPYVYPHPTQSLRDMIWHTTFGGDPEHFKRLLDTILPQNTP